jgi:hypothetical protein
MENKKIDIAPEVSHNQLSTTQAQQNALSQICLTAQEQKHPGQQAWPIDNVRSQSCNNDIVGEIL